MSAREFVEWLGIIPNRHWLVIGDAELASVIRELALPSAVTELPASQAEDLPFESGTFDVVVLAGEPSAAAVRELRRVLWPAGIGALFWPGSSDQLLRTVGMHAAQSCELGVRGTR